jgi:hypothetical protein
MEVARRGTRNWRRVATLTPYHESEELIKRTT